MKDGFIYDFQIHDERGSLIDAWIQHNVLTDAGRDYLATYGVLWEPLYIGLYTSNYNPVHTDTMLTMIALCGEATSYTTSNNVRLAWNTQLSNGAYSNVLAPAPFLFAAPTDIYGGFTTTSPTRSGTDGVLLSAERNPTVKHLSAGNTLRVIAAIPFTNY